VALILALNPGNSHSPTLSRLARELHGCELIGAESCVVGIKAIKERVPDVVLLPAKPARGEADLLAHLKAVPGGVLTLRLPPVESADPLDLARQIREMLTGPPVSAHPGPTSVAAGLRNTAPVGTSPDLLGAAAAAISWIRSRRAQWVEEQQEDAVPEPVAQWTGVSPSVSDEGSEPYEPFEPSESDDPYETPDTDEPHSTRAAQIKTWLPRAAALAVVIGIAGALVSCWPQIRGTFSGPVDPVSSPKEPPAQEAILKPAVTPLAAESEADPLANVSGWVAVFAPFEVQISEGNQGRRADDRGRVMLAPGRHSLRFRNRELGYDETRTVEVRPTATTTNLTPQTTIGVTSNEPAEVLIDGTRVGDTPYEGSVALGTHAVTVKTSGAERLLTVEASSKPIQLEVDFSKP
jgi:hypothetical protein